MFLACFSCRFWTIRFVFLINQQLRAFDLKGEIFMLLIFKFLSFWFKGYLLFIYFFIFMQLLSVWETIFILIVYKLIWYDLIYVMMCYYFVRFIFLLSFDWTISVQSRSYFVPLIYLFISLAPTIRCLRGFYDLCCIFIFIRKEIFVLNMNDFAIVKIESRLIKNCTYFLIKYRPKLIDSLWPKSY